MAAYEPNPWLPPATAPPAPMAARAKLSIGRRLAAVASVVVGLLAGGLAATTLTGRGSGSGASTSTTSVTAPGTGGEPAPGPDQHAPPAFPGDGGGFGPGVGRHHR